MFYGKQAIESLDLPRWLSGKEPTCNAGDVGSIPELRRLPWRRKWWPNPVFLPGKLYGERSLVGYISWGCKRVGYDLVSKPTATWNLLSLKRLGNSKVLVQCILSWGVRLVRACRSFQLLGHLLLPDSALWTDKAALCLWSSRGFPLKITWKF